MLFKLKIKLYKETDLLIPLYTNTESYILQTLVKIYTKHDISFIKN